MHKNPHHYSDEWTRWGDWLGILTFTRNLKKQELRKNITYTKAQKFAKKLKIESSSQYKSYVRGDLKINNCPCPIWLTSKPERDFKGKGWKNWADFLGSVEIATKDKIFWNYKKASAHFIKLKKVNTWADFRRYRKGEIDGYRKCPEGIPSRPETHYKKSGRV